MTPELPDRPDLLPALAPPPATEDADLFVALASHELRTPITVIKGFADTVDQHWDALSDDARRQAVRVIGQRAGELAALVDRLLASTVHSTAAIVCQPFDLLSALREAAGGLRAELRGRLRVRLPATLPPAYGDRAAIAPVLAELVGNATRYSSGEVELSADADAQAVRILVSDRGEGIAPEDAERAFTRYWQANPDVDGQHPGFGLGLHLVRRIVERQRGWVSLRPRRSGGTVVEVTLVRSDMAEKT